MFRHRVFRLPSVFSFEYTVNRLYLSYFSFGNHIRAKCCQNRNAVSEIRKQLTFGVFYTAIAKYTGIFISLVVTGVLSRLLTPADFGTIVPITVLVAFFSILGDVGIGPAVIQHQTLSHKDLDSIFSFTVLTGALLAGIFFAGSWGIAALYESPVFVPLSQLLSVTLFFSCANVVPNALLFKAKKFRFLAVRSLVVQSAAGGIAIAAAYLGAGLYALVIQSVVSSACMFLLSYRENPLRLLFLRLDWEPLKKIRSFSSYQFLFNILNYFSVNLDKLLIKKYMGATPLGYYDKSYRLMQLPLQYIPFVITPVMHPIFSEMQNDLEKMRTYYSKVVRFLAFIGFPLSVLLHFTGRDLIYILFGSQWGASVPVFEILALSVGFQMILSTSGSIFQSAGSTKLLFLCGILSTVTIVSAVLTGLFAYRTLVALGILLLGAFIVNFFLCYAILYRFLFKTGFAAFLKQLGSPLLLSFLLALILYALTPAAARINAILSLLLKGGITVVVSGLYIQLTGEYDLFRQVRRLADRFRKR